jgi:prepilin-type N-terminal cleavage/methylation domain-containing protein
MAPRMTGRRRGAERAGFTLVEVMVAMALLCGVVLSMALGLSLLSRSVVGASGRSRAQALADQQIARARVWPAYGTLAELGSVTYNGAVDGFTVSTAVSIDSTNRQHITRLTVTVSSTNAALLPAPVMRTITLAAP